MYRHLCTEHPLIPVYRLLLPPIRAVFHDRVWSVILDFLDCNGTNSLKTIRFEGQSSLEVSGSQTDRKYISEILCAAADIIGRLCEHVYYCLHVRLVAFFVHGKHIPANNFSEETVIIERQYHLDSIDIGGNGESCCQDISNFEAETTASVVRPGKCLFLIEDISYSKQEIRAA